MPEFLISGIHKKKKPAIEIAGMCLPLKPQKERFPAITQTLLQFFFDNQPGFGNQDFIMVEHLK
jgi:hypothetical protein